MDHTSKRIPREKVPHSVARGVQVDISSALNVMGRAMYNALHVGRERTARTVRQVCAINAVRGHTSRDRPLRPVPRVLCTRTNQGRGSPLASAVLLVHTPTELVPT